MMRHVKHAFDQRGQEKRVMKFKLNVLAVLGATLVSGSVMALEIFPTLYVGAEAQYNFNKITKEMKSTSGGLLTRGNNKPLISEHGAAAGIFIGTNLWEMLSLEAGYYQFKRNKTDDSANFNGVIPGVTAQLQSVNAFTARHHNWYLDGVACFPLPLVGMDILASAGIGRLTSKIENTNTANAGITFPPAATLSFANKSSMKGETTRTGLRLGLGAQYKFGDLGTRFMVRYQQGNDLIKHVVSAGVGLFYQFY